MEHSQIMEIAVENLTLAGERAGLSVRDLLTLLESGMTVEQLVQYLATKLSDRPVEN